MGDYAEFLAGKAQIGMNDGFAPSFLPDDLFPFQSHLMDWSIRKGRCALFEDCGLGKTLQELVWATNVLRHTNKPVLLLTPMAVAQQTIREAEKFGIEAFLSLDGKVRHGVNVVNYDRLHYFDSNDFAGAVGDESACLKDFSGKRRQEVTEFMRRMRYRLLATATPAPNEYIELGTTSEALGHLGYMDMLARFFKNNQNNSIKPFRMALRPQRDDRRVLEDGKWRFKGHAEGQFWKWVCSWARAVRKPSDLGFSDAGYDLPPLIERQHEVKVSRVLDGGLFAVPAVGLAEQRKERRNSLEDRCAKAADLVNPTGRPAIVWCSLNDEGDLLEKLIPDCVQVSGRDSEEAKEEKFLAFITGKFRVLVTKETIGAWGLNFQHCAHSVSFPTHSFERYYQSIRRCWRFGQTQEVVSDIVTTEGEANVLANLKAKSEAAEQMFAGLVAHMNDAMGIDRGVTFDKMQEMPSWL